MIKERTTIRVSGSDINGDDATVAFTSDVIRFKDVWQLSINFFFNSLTFSGKSPTITIQEGNDDKAPTESFVPIAGWTDVDVPEFFKDFKTTSEFINIVYNPQGATGGTIGAQTRIIKP